MKITPTPEQRTLRETLTEFLDEELTPLVRRMADRSPYANTEDAPDIRAMIHQALTDLGLPALSLPEGQGGQGRPQEAWAVAAELLGAALYQGPLLDTVTAAELLARTAAGGARDELLPAVADGTRIALAVREHGTGTTAVPARLTVGQDRKTISGTRTFVGFVPEADHLLVVGHEGSTVRAALVRPDAPGVTARRHEELGRGELYAVVFDAAPVDSWLETDAGATLAEDWRTVLDAARVRQAAYLVGLGQGVLDLAVSYAKSRKQFGKPLGHQQVIALRLADLTARLDAVRLVVRAAAWAVDRRTGAVRLEAAQALAMAAETARKITAEVMQVHGAYGMTEDSDAQLFYRRAAVESLRLGSPAELRGEVAPLLKDRLTGLVHAQSA
ncbi:acyl-CoA dehydrogenase family protein [Streptomyces sp. NPDC001407]|uniref:acyl-CoA dehydrogenase family protein n=1 Tax=Streptomyces sp. NPDC001407 TaxID=3364573 RepID=UPI00367D7CD2